VSALLERSPLDVKGTIMRPIHSPATAIWTRRQSAIGSSDTPRGLRYLVQRVGAGCRHVLTALDRMRGSVRLPALPSPASVVPGDVFDPMSACAPRSATRRHVILFLAANPSETTRLALDEECAAVERELRMTTGRDDFDFRSKWAVSVDEMMRHLNELQPTIIHFSGHGGGSTGIYLEDGRRAAPAVHRDISAGCSDAGIYLQDEHRQQQHVRARALAQMIGSAAPSARLVVLNACFSDPAAEALRNMVDCVVGMSGAIGDDAARSFAVGFYRALGHRRSVGNAFDQAVATLAGKRLPGEHLPVCRTRDGVSAAQVTLPQLDPPPS
jgi:CHAT domain